MLAVLLLVLPALSPLVVSVHLELWIHIMDPKYRSLGTSPSFGRVIDFIFLIQCHRSGAFARKSPLTCLCLICSQGTHRRTGEEAAIWETRLRPFSRYSLPIPNRNWLIFRTHLLLWNRTNVLSWCSCRDHINRLVARFTGQGGVSPDQTCTTYTLRYSHRWKVKYLIFNCQRQQEKHLLWNNYMDLFDIAPKGKALCWAMWIAFQV